MKLIVKKEHAPILKTENFENSIFLKRDTCKKFHYFKSNAKDFPLNITIVNEASR